MMRGVWIIVMMGMLAVTARAQQIHIYGQAVRGDSALAGVMIMIFEQQHFYKKFITGKDGQFRFFLGNKDYTVMFYKPGMMPEASHIVDNMETDILKIPIHMEMRATSLSADSVLVHSPLISQTAPEVAQAYIAAVYEYERSRPDARRDSASIATRRTLMRQAIVERDRFAHYRRSAARTTAGDSTVSITIGPDVYELLTDTKGQHRYYKNSKPITDATYDFETVRRYEGVLKNRRDVRRFERYRPQEHVKGK